MTSERSVPLQRVSVVARVPGLLAEWGIPADVVFAGLQIRPADLTPDNRVPFREILALLDACERVTGRADFGLQVGARADHRDLGAIGEVMTCAATLGEALSDYLGVQPGFSQAAAAWLAPSGPCHALGFNKYDHHAPGSAQGYGMVMALAANMIRNLTGGRVTPVEVHFSHRAPADVRPYRAVLGAEPLFDQHQTCVVIPPGGLSAPLPTADPARRERLLAEVLQSLQPEQRATRARLRHALRPLLSRGETSRAAAAARLGLHPRTLNRLLAEEGTSFEQERDAVRMAVACELLAMTGLDTGEIALALSFSSHTGFTRAFRRWSDTTPTAWRQRYRERHPM